MVYSRRAGSLSDINLVSGKASGIRGDEYASGTSKYYMFQGNLGGSPSGQITVKRIEDMKSVSFIQKPHDTHSPVRLSGDGKYFTTVIKEKTYIHDSDTLKRLRSVVGHVVAFIPGTSLALSLKEVSHDIAEIKEMNVSIFDLSSGELLGQTKVKPPTLLLDI